MIDPIASAPRDGGYILVHGPGWEIPWLVSAWVAEPECEDGGYWAHVAPEDIYDDEAVFSPTHWAPLPPTPAV
ncbi:MAG: hypothetical protein WAY02_12100 [Burkholderiaceae bacterium]